MLWLLTHLDRYGWKILVAFFFFVYWQQDFDLVNNGYDIITLRPNDRHYFHGTYYQQIALIRLKR